MVNALSLGALSSITCPKIPLNLLQQSHRQCNERHEQRGNRNSVRHEQRRVGRGCASDEVRTRYHEWFPRKQRLLHYPLAGNDFLDASLEVVLTNPF